MSPFGYDLIDGLAGAFLDHWRLYVAVLVAIVAGLGGLVGAWLF
jgi:hypothetical protein